jgi:hypothetical protein
VVSSAEHILVDARDQYVIFYYLLVDVAGCMAALDAEHYLQEVGPHEGKSYECLID